MDEQNRKIIEMLDREIGALTTACDRRVVGDRINTVTGEILGVYMLVGPNSVEFVQPIMPGITFAENLN